MNIGSLVGYLGLDSSAFDQGLQDAQTDLEGFGAKGKVLAAAAGALIAGGLAAGVVGAMNVEAANDKLTAQLGLSAQESERVGKSAGELYAKGYGDSLTGVNDAAAAVIGSIQGMREASSADLQLATRDALNFATAMNIDVTAAARSAGNLVKTGLAADAGAAFDLLTVTAQKAGPAMVEPVMEAANEYSTYFAAMGLSGEQAMGLLVRASADGEIAIDKAGDAVKEFSIRATDGSKLTSEAYQAIGLDADKMANRLLAGGDTAAIATTEIVDGLLSIKDPATQANTAIALFGTPLEDIGVTKIPEFLSALQSSNEVMGDTAGAAEHLDRTLSGNASTAWTELKRGVETTAIALADRLLPAVLTVFTWLGDNLGPAVEEVTGFLGDHETVVKAIAIAIAAALVVYGTYAATTRTISAVTKGWAAAQAALNFVMGMNPILLVAMAVAALAAGLIYAYQNSETFRDIVNGAFDAVKRGVGNAVGFLIDGFRLLLMVFLTVADGIVSGAATALSWVPGLGEKLQAANTAFDNMKDGVLATLDEAAQKAYGFGEQSGNNLARGVGGTAGRVFGATRGVADGIGQAVAAASGGAYGAGYGVGSNAGQGVIDGVNAKRAAAARAAAALSDAVIANMNRVMEINSPSRKTTWMGHMLGEGLIVGMQQIRPAVAAELANLGRMEALTALPVQSPVYARQLAAPGRAAAPTAGGPMTARPQGGYGSLVNIEGDWITQETSPQGMAQALLIEARTSAGWTS
ncbi:hypothetical protein DQ244_01635 [Blastococcus sp. TBT05-19]|uniref:phage tail tape measure protein n=1 Tax=Blastococcus sp. TBT05-19 TaxID=2250581 RepID=UPI000DE9C742|nr:phage tail tape measure protein [Blastococcus sp. TBT05-19]RBY94089.1 hypothetical protein DQ244_01635 [Blastococcus sp. TBT05-19]